MKRLNTSMAAAGICLGLAGCASPTQLTIRQPVGPAPTAPTAAAGESSLRVYSARERAPIDPNRDEFFANDFGNNDILFEPAHSDYRIYTQDGSLLQKVKNARGLSDAAPARVTLAPGLYPVKADAELPDGETFAVSVPVEIEPGQTTTVHLEPGWEPTGARPDPNSLVRVYDGRIVGWRADIAAPQQASR